MIARLTVKRGTLTEYPLAERVRGGWQNGVTFYDDADVVEVQTLDVRRHEPCGPIAEEDCEKCSAERQNAIPDREICPQPCEHLSQEDAREGRTCAEHPCTCTNREIRCTCHIDPDGTEYGGDYCPVHAPNREDGCPTCSGPVRETVGMVCQTCGTDYATDRPNGSER